MKEIIVLVLAGTQIMSLPAKIGDSQVNRAPSDNLDTLLAAFAKLEYRDVVGIKLKLAEALIKVMETTVEMLKYEVKVRDVQKFMPPLKQPHKADNGSYM